MASTTNIILVGIGGPSSSGKTTLARLLRDIWPDVFILHEDDFYWSDDEIPMNDGVKDWDCLEALNLRELSSTLRHIKQEGTVPAEFKSKEDENSVGECDVDPQVIETLEKRAADVTTRSPPIRIAIIDGFLLYAKEMKNVWDLLDVRLFLKTDYATAKQRRETRTGYVTIEGFWVDPPGYVDDIVWPNYVKDHAFLFQNGNVEGEYDQEACKSMSLRPVPDTALRDMTAMLSWAFEEVQSAVLGHQA